MNGISGADIPVRALGEAKFKSEIAMRRLLLLAITLMLISRVSASAKDVEFRAELLEDSIYVFEEVWCEFTVVNHDTVPIARLPLMLDDPISFEFIDSTGQELPKSRLSILDGPGVGDTLSPGDSVKCWERIVSDLRSIRPGEENWRGYLPAGSYKVSSYFPYVHPKHPLTDSPFACDTLALKILQPENQDNVAFASLAPLVKNYDPGVVLRFLRFHDQFPGTAYAEDALFRASHRAHDDDSPDLRV